MSMRCTLVGMPGSGKSTVGRQLARRLGCPVVDMDQRLEERLGCGIRAYFDARGEDAFRDEEAALLAELAANSTDMVLSTGGGVVLREGNRALLRTACAPVFYLRASADDIWRRVRHDHRRPLLQVDDPLERLRALYQERDPLYREVAHYVIETRRSTVQGLVNRVQMQLELAAGTSESVET